MEEDFLLQVEVPDDVAESIKTNNWLASSALGSATQDGEEGIIDAILQTMGIEAPGWCVEFGACDGQRYSNSLKLIVEKGWHGVLIESDPQWFARLQDNYRDRPDVHCLHRAVHWEGANRLDNILAETPVPRDFTLLTIDIDGCDYHVWEALRHYRPLVVMIEFHWLTCPSVRVRSPKDMSVRRGSSLGAIADLGKSKGYELICVNGNNAFFVTRENFEIFHIADNRPERMYSPREEFRIFQGYDGTLRLFNNTIFHWQSQIDAEGTVANVRISQRDIQVLPDGLRVFRPRHTYRCDTLARQAGRLDAARCPSNAFLAHRRNVTSECGEDGILEAVFARIGIHRGVLVDVGAGDGQWCSQTWQLYEQGWSGISIEKDPDCYATLSRRYEGSNRVRCVLKKVRRSGADSLDALISDNGIQGGVDFLTIDVEGNDYHLWESLRRCRPAVVAIDLNPSISNDVLYAQAYDARSPFGASLRALIALGAVKVYGLAAATDWNAIFVRDDLFSKLGIAHNTIDEMYYPPFEMRMTQTMDNCLHLLTCRTLVRQDHRIPFEEFQVLPSRFRSTVNYEHEISFVEDSLPADPAAAVRAMSPAEQFGKSPSAFYDR